MEDSADSDDIPEPFAMEDHGSQSKRERSLKITQSRPRFASTPAKPIAQSYDGSEQVSENDVITRPKKKEKKKKDWKQSASSWVRTIRKKDWKDIDIHHNHSDQILKTGSPELPMPVLTLSPPSQRLRHHTILWSNLSLQLQSELAKRQRRESKSNELKKRAENINLEISVLVTKKASDESILREANEAKKRVPEIEKLIQQKRIEFNEVVKQMRTERLLRKEEKQKFEDHENIVSIVKDVGFRKILLHKVKKIPLIPSTEVMTVTFSGPNEHGKGIVDASDPLLRSDDVTFRENMLRAQSLLESAVSGRSVSTYPLKAPGGTEREGDPICDRFLLCHYEYCTIAVLAG